MSIAKRIIAIIAQAESTTFEGEAELFMQKAEALMAKHGITLCDVERADDPLDFEAAGETGMAASKAWQRHLINHIALYYSCHILAQQVTRSRFEIAISGTLSGCTMVKVMWPYIKKEVTRVAQNMRAISGQSLEAEKRAVAMALCLRLCKIIDEREAAERAGASETNALVVLDQALVLLKEKTGSFRSTGARVRTHDAAVQAAGQISLNAQAGNSAHTKRIGVSA